MLAVLSLEWKESKFQLVVNAPKCFRVVNCDGESRPVLTIPLSFPDHLLRDCQRGRDFNDRAMETLVSDAWCSKSNCSQFSSAVMRCVSIFPTLDNRGSELVPLIRKYLVVPLNVGECVPTDSILFCIFCHDRCILGGNISVPGRYFDYHQTSSCFGVLTHSKINPSSWFRPSMCPISWAMLRTRNSC